MLVETVRPDFALVKGWKSDKHGNIIFRKAAQNFNVDCAWAGKVTIVEVEEIVDGSFDSDQVHLSNAVVDYVIQGDHYVKPIERKTIKKGESIEIPWKGERGDRRIRIA